MAAMTNVWTMIWSKIFFHEPITRGKVGALGMILAGIVCIGLGGR
jgi:drug/metabolite transporter (DMT)-like permease